MRLAGEGWDATVQSVTYEGGRFRVEAAVIGGNETVTLHEPEPCALRAGETVRIAIDDGWVIPSR